jgi:spermidine/putrescine transport system ATP-binding protein
VQCANPSDLYRYPANRFVAEFIGRVNLLSGTTVEEEGQIVFVANGTRCFALPRQVLPEGRSSGSINLVLRPENVQIDASGDLAGDGVRLRARILHSVYGGATTSYVLEIAGGLRLIAEQQNTLGRPRQSEGDAVDIYVHPEAISAVPDS